MSRAVACALAVLTVACSGPQLKEHVADLSKNLPATLEAERPKEGDARTVTIRVYADPAVRALPKWKDELTDQIDYASQLLTPLLGVKLQVEKVNDWARTGDPSAALAQLRELDKGEGVTWVLGVIAPNDTVTKVMSELGAGEPLGHHVILRAWAEKPETDALATTLPDLKDAERGELINAHRRHKQTVVLVHMLAATLGAIEETDPQWLQNPTYSPKQSGFSERNRELLQLAVDERVSDGSEESIAKKVLEAIEKSEWGGWVAADKEQVVNRLRNVIDSKRAGKTATDIPAAAYDQITRITELNRQCKVDDAMAELDNVIAAYPGNGALTQKKCELLLKALVCANQDPPKKGEKPKPPPPPKAPDARVRAACARVSELVPGDPSPHVAVGEALLDAGDRKGAREELLKAEGKIANLPGGTEIAWRRLINDYQRMGSLTWTDEALAKAKLAKDDLSAGVAETRNRYGVPPGAKFVTPDREGDLVTAVKKALAEVYASKYADAEKTLAAAERSWPGAPGLAATRCDLDLRRGNAGAAKAACERALASYPNESWALYLLGTIAFKDTSLASTKVGIEHLKKAIALDPGLGQAWRTLGKAYERAKDPAAREKLATDYQAKFGTPMPR